MLFRAEKPCKAYDVRIGFCHKFRVVSVSTLEIPSENLFAIRHWNDKRGDYRNAWFQYGEPRDNDNNRYARTDHEPLFHANIIPHKSKSPSEEGLLLSGQCPHRKNCADNTASNLEISEEPN